MNQTSEVPKSNLGSHRGAELWSERYDVEAAREYVSPEPAGSARAGVVRLAGAVERVLTFPLSAMLVGGSPDTLANGLTAPKRLVDRWSFYADPMLWGEPGAFFKAPPAPRAVELSPTRHILATPARGTVTDIRFESTFVPANSDLRDRYLADVRNRTVHARWWRHAEGPRPTIVCIHGLQAGSHLINVEFFDVRGLYVDGYDVVLFQLPYHGARASVIEGWSYLSLDIAHLAEVIAHSISDVRALITHLFAEGAPQVGVKGVSLGGYLAALLAAVDRRLAFAVPVAAPVSLPDLVSDLFPFGRLLPRLLGGIGWDLEVLRLHMACHTPLQYPVLLPPERLLIVAAAGDRLVPPYHARLLQEHWNDAEVEWRPGSHQIHLDRRAYRARLRKLFADIDFAPALLS